MQRPQRGVVNDAKKVDDLMPDIPLFSNRKCCFAAQIFLSVTMGGPYSYFMTFVKQGKFRYLIRYLTFVRFCSHNLLL
uniref:Uncharacterized protein n=1 Tax=Rhizophora mucronata TaxID=61149 RepID=A0A2P2KJJ7_RHIMU